MTLLEHINYASRQIDSLNRLRTAIGVALTPEQQVAVSAKIAGGPDPFITWVGTPEGKELIQMVADKFAGPKAVTD